jgi:peptidoglycan/LPS O-acetylase OafA/YrhL
MKLNKSKQKDIIYDNKIFGWIALVTVAILMIPFIMMQFSADWNWSSSDFIIIGILLFGAGFLFVQTARIVPRKHRVATAAVFVLGVLYLWAEMAVGIFTNLGS